MARNLASQHGNGKIQNRTKQKKSKTKFSNDELITGMAILADAAARVEGPTKKKWTLHDMRAFKPKTQRQEDALRAYGEGDNLGLFGSSGTGKTLLAMYLGFSTMLQPGSEIQEIIIARSAVPGREVGALPGTLDDKLVNFEDPFMEACTFLFGKKSTYGDMKAAEKIRFVSTSYLRGRTFDNAFIIFDECQNTDLGEIHTVMTRVGKHSRIILCGDTRQIDLTRNRKWEVSGLPDFMLISKRLKHFTSVVFTKYDVLRSNFAKEWIIAYEDFLEDRNAAASSTAFLNNAVNLTETVQNHQYA